MMHTNRRDFLQSAALLTGGLLMGASFTQKDKVPLLAFSTLGCPDWTFKQIIDFAIAQQYKGIELRGIQRQLDLTKCNEFSTAQNRKDTLKMMQDNGLHFVDLGSSCTLHFADAAERKKNLDEGKRFIDLANDIDCAYVRVFPNNFPAAQTKEQSMELISSGLLELGEYAQNTKVTVLIESHGDLVKTDDLEKIMQSSAHQHVGMIWDISNMWTITKEPPAAVYERLKKYIRHTHIKDGKQANGKLEYTLLGQGEVPILEAIDILHMGGYKGYYSFEWEKLWHPEIAEPEIALADYIKVLKAHFNF